MKIETVVVAAKLEVGDLICLTGTYKRRRYYAVVLEPMCNDFNNLIENEPIAKVRQLSNGQVCIWRKGMFTKFEFVTHLDECVVEYSTIVE